MKVKVKSFRVRSLGNIPLLARYFGSAFDVGASRDSAACRAFNSVNFRLEQELLRRLGARV